MIVSLKKLLAMALAYRLVFSNALGFNPGIRLVLRYAALRLRGNLTDRDRLRWYRQRLRGLFERRRGAAGPQR
ncbi:MAG: hypothetical protein KDH15_10160 [Rhodocyclaceae bacterium]|nr:hypothetical protein [Rhodocyclaceae bacterium]